MVVAEINDKLNAQVPGEAKVYKSIDRTCEPEDEVIYTREFLNSRNDISGVPPHQLSLKIGTPIMLLRNLDPPNLVNGTRLVVKKLMNHVIEAKIITGPGASNDTVFVPRIPIEPKGLTFRFRRLQFPVVPCYAMSINKSQGNCFLRTLTASNCFLTHCFFIQVRL